MSIEPFFIPEKSIDDVQFLQVTFYSIISVVSIAHAKRQYKIAHKWTDSSVFHVGHVLFCIFAVMTETFQLVDFDPKKCQSWRRYMMLSIPHFVLLSLISALFFNHW